MLVVVGGPAQRVSYAEYLAFERNAETKHEFVDGSVVAMAGGTPEHSRLAMSVGVALMNARLAVDAIYDDPLD